MRVAPNLITLASGRQLHADYVVLATGSHYPFPAKNEIDDTAAAQPSAAGHVLLLRASPVGLEFAGDIKAAWPQKQVVIVDPAAGILGEYDPKRREAVREQLAELGVQLVLGSALQADPATAAGELGRVRVTTEANADIAADIWFRCYDAVPNTGALASAFVDARHANGQIAVADTLQVKGRTPCSRSVTSPTSLNPGRAPPCCTPTLWRRASVR